jgi:predicted nucleic acid-binding protein
VIYLDSSAAVKLVKDEKETEAVRAWRRSVGPDRKIVTSSVTPVEIFRSLLRDGVDAERAKRYAGHALADVSLLEITGGVLARANGYLVQRLGSLDAIHLASAEHYRPELTEFVTYDRELAVAAERLGLRVVAPS